MHPPPVGPAGTENARSLVLRVRHASHTLLLTGDLADEGLKPGTAVAQVARRCAARSPHHGSRTANTPELAEWARPRRVVVISRGAHGR